jgi:quinone-modifying oxidoreductase subunit QmoC
MIDVSPNIAFIEKLQAASGSQLTTCMQCGACTASCSLSADQDVFPRRQMMMAAWGMRDRLMADPYVWTCHQCGDCTVSCPRGVSPGDVMAALRQEQIVHYSRPRFIARWIRTPACLPLVVLFPMFVILLILLMAGTLHIPEGPVDYSKFFPHGWLNGSFTALFILSTIGAVGGLKSFLKATRPGLKKSGPGNPEASASGNPEAPVSGLSKPETGNPEASGRWLRVIGRILWHMDFRQCTEQKSRSLSHLFVFWGFILLLFVTFFAILSTLFFHYPLGFLNPVKIAGNTGALLLFTGSTLMILNRLLKRNTLRSNYADWFFLLSFWLLTVTGILVEAARFLDWSHAYHIYLFHLILVWIIILYYPYTRFAHFLYRTLSLLLIGTTKPT